MSFLINQRVEVNGEIVIHIRPPAGEMDQNNGSQLWVKYPDGTCGLCSYRDVHPLPNGQL